jgi:hypothetical protein
MRNYGKISPQFWIGKTGKSLRREGALAQLVALYLITSPHANLLGMYHLPLSYIAHYTGLSIEDAQRGLQGCIASGLCLYDDASDTVWVLEMARFQVAETLTPRDKRILSVQNEYDNLPANPFLPAFYERYGAALLMVCARTSEGDRMPFGRASQGHRSQEQEQEQEQEKEHEHAQEQERDQEQGQGGEQEHFFAGVPSASHRADGKKIKFRPRPLDVPNKSPLPEDFGISDDVRRWARERHIENLDLHLENFISAARRNAYTYADWDEAFKEAIRKDWAAIGRTATGNASPTSKLGKAGQATANNARRWLEDIDAGR